MAFKIIFFHLFTAIVAVNLIFADESDRLFGLPFFGGNSGGNDSSPFSGFFNQLPSFFNSASRQKRSPDHHEAREPRPRPEYHYDRRSPISFVSCNFTSQGFLSCSNCTHALQCFPWNRGIARNCGQLNLTCSNGFCRRNSTGCASDSE